MSTTCEDCGKPTDHATTVEGSNRIICPRCHTLRTTGDPHVTIVNLRGHLHRITSGAIVTESSGSNGFAVDIRISLPRRDWERMKEDAQ
jgi:hypothetical protein